MGPIPSAPPRPAQLIWRNRTLGAASLLAVLVLFELLAHHSLTDLDIWFHLRAGRDLLAGDGWPHTNTYSFTNPQFPWLNHEWLFQVLTTWTGPTSPLAELAVAGWNALRQCLILILGMLLLLGDGNLGKLRHGTSGLALALTSLATLAALLFLWPRFNLRPELVSYIFLVLLVREVDRYYYGPPPRRPWRSRSVWRMFAIIVFWAQFHGFATLGPLIVLIGIAVRRWPARPQHSGHVLSTWTATAVWVPGGLGVLALCLTPNLWHGLLFPLRALGQFSDSTASLSQTVSELVPLLQTRNALGLTMTAFKLSLVWVAVFAVLGWGRISLLRLVLVVGAAAAALASQRNIALFGVTFVLLHTGTMAYGPTPWWRARLKTKGPPVIVATLGAVATTLLVVVVCSWWGASIVSNDFYLKEGVGRRFGSGCTPAIYPQAAAAALTDSQAGHTFANLDAAAFLLGTTEARLFVDGRTEAYPNQRWVQYLQFRNAGPEAGTALIQSGVSAVVLSLGSGAFTAMAEHLLASPNWTLVAADAGGILCLRAATRTRSTPGTILSEAAHRSLVASEPDPTRQADLCLAAANLQQLNHQPAAAEESLRNGLAVRPDHPALNHNLGNILLAAGKYTEAAIHFGRALDKNGRLAGSALNLGVCQLRLKQVDTAANSFQRSLAIDPNQVAGWVNLALARRQSGQKEAAITALQKALDLHPDDPRLQRRLREWRRSGP